MAENKDIHDQRMVLEVTRRVSKAVRILRDKKVVVGVKGGANRLMWRLAP